MTVNIKPILKYLGIFIAYFLVLTAISFTEPVKKGINEWYGKTHTGIFKTLLPEVEMTYYSWEKTGDPDEFNYLAYGKKEMERLIAEAKAKGLRSVNQTSIELKFFLNVFFTPFLVFLLSLILATPIPLKNKLIALLVGLLLFLAYQVFRAYIRMLDLINAQQIGVYDFEGTSERLLNFTVNTLQAGFTTAVVALIWAMLVFNKKNLAHLKAKFGF